MNKIERISKLEVKYNAGWSTIAYWITGKYSVHPSPLTESDKAGLARFTRSAMKIRKPGMVISIFERRNQPLPLP